MKKVISATLAVVLLLAGALFSGQLSPAKADAPLIFEFNTMVGIPQAFTGAQAPIRGSMAADYHGCSPQRMVGYYLAVY